MTAASTAGGNLATADVVVETHETRYEGYFRLDRYWLRHRLFAGGWSGSMGREVFERGHAVALVLYDADRDLLVLIEQFRAGAFAALQAGDVKDMGGPWLIEIVAGIIGDGESLEEVARREAMEEAGCVVRELVPICRVFVSPGASTETVALYFARISAPAVGGIHGLADEHEDIRVHLVSPDQAFAWVDEGRIVNGPTIIGLQWFRLNAGRYRRPPSKPAA